MVVVIEMNTKTKPAKAKNGINRKKDDSSSLLEVFISARTKHYDPPERKGKKRGEAIGIPLHKYKASLLYLTVDGQKGIAKGAKVSYGLLRKWKTEQEFRNLIKEHKKDFIEVKQILATRLI